MSETRWGSVWLRALRMEACWNVTHWSSKVTEALSVLCPMFNLSASFQAFITHRFLSAVSREDIQRPEPVPRLSLGPHQLWIRRAGPDLARKLQRSLQGTAASLPYTGWRWEELMWQLALMAGDFLPVKQYHVWSLRSHVQILNSWHEYKKWKIQNSLFLTVF